MAVTRTQKINLGIFVIVSATLLIGGIVLLVGLKLWEVRDTYTLRFSTKETSMSGLDIGSPVKYSGIQVGRVTSIRIDPDDVSIIIVVIEIEGGTPIAVDSRARLDSIGITGLKYVELTGGSPGTTLREPGDEIPTIASLMDEITGKAGVITQKTEHFLNKINEFLSDERQAEFWGTITEIRNLARTAELTVSTTQPELAMLAKNLSALAEELDHTVGHLNGILEKNGPEINDLVATARSFAEGLQATRQNIDGLIRESRTLMSSLNKNMGQEGLEESIVKLNSFLDRATLFLKRSEEDIAISLEHLRETSTNLDEFSIAIRENPSLLLRTQDTPEREFK